MYSAQNHQRCCLSYRIKNHWASHRCFTRNRVHSKMFFAGFDACCAFSELTHDSDVRGFLNCIEPCAPLHFPENSLRGKKNYASTYWYESIWGICVDNWRCKTIEIIHCVALASYCLLMNHFWTSHKPVIKSELRMFIGANGIDSELNAFPVSHSRASHNLLVIRSWRLFFPPRCFAKCPRAYQINVEYLTPAFRGTKNHSVITCS